MANKCLLKSFLCHFSCWITRIANSYRGRMTFDRFRFCKGEWVEGEPHEAKRNPQKAVQNDSFTLLPAVSRGITGCRATIGEKCTKTILMPKQEIPLLNLSLCVSVREYRGSARRARGLNTIVEQKYETPPPVVSRNITGYRLANRGGRTSTLHRKVLSSSPVFCNAKYKGRCHGSDGGVKTV